MTNALDDWSDTTELLTWKKRGPALRNWLEAKMAVYKRLLLWNIISRDFCNRILSKQLKQCFCIASCSSWNLAVHNGWQRWITKFRITRNRLIEPCTDLLPDLETKSSEAIGHVAQRRQIHEQGQQNLARIRRRSTHQYAMDRRNGHGHLQPTQ